MSSHHLLIVPGFLTEYSSSRHKGKGHLEQIAYHLQEKVLKKGALDPLSSFDVPEVLEVQVIPSDEVRVVPVSPTVTKVLSP